MNEQELKNLLDHYLAGTASEREKQQLETWYQAFEAQPGLTDQLSASLKEALEERMLAKIQARIGAAEPIATQRPLWQPAFWLRLAASLVFVLLSGWWGLRMYQNRQPTPVEYTQVVTPPGQIRQVILPDGSKIWLNAASKLRYARPFQADKREVWLEGEASFSVVHQPQRPFQVHTGALLTNVLGTVFNVEAYGESPQILVTVQSGKVGVASPSHQMQLLTPNQQLIYEKENVEMIRRPVDARLVGAWTSGELAFRSMSFAQIAARLERHYKVKILFTSEALKTCLLSARFEAKTPLPDVVRMLCRINGNTFTQAAGSDTLRIHGQGCH